AAGLVAVALSVGLQGLDALDLPLSGLRHKLAWEAGLATSYGATAVAAALALLLALFGCAAKSTSTARALSLVGVLGVGLALALSGHASAAAPELLNRPAVFLHAVCVALWVGSLLPLYLAVCSVRRRDAHSAVAQLERFSRAIPPVIALLVASGLWRAFVHVDRIAGPSTTSYGQLLACTLACVAIVLALAAANRYRLVPRFETGGAAAARPLATAIGFELAIALLILGLVALWRFTPPPRALAVAAPISLHLHGEKAMAEIEIERNGEAAGASLLLLDGVSAARGQGGHAGARQSRRRDRAHAPDRKAGRRDELADRRSAHSGRRSMDPRRRNPDQRFRQGDSRGHGHAAAPP